WRNWHALRRRPTHERPTKNPHLPVPAPAAAGQPSAPAARRRLPAALRAAGPRAAGRTPVGLGAALRAADRCRLDCHSCGPGRPRPLVARPGDPDPELAPSGLRYSGSALVPAADRAGPRPDSLAATPAADTGRGLERTAGTLASLASQKGIGPGPLTRSAEEDARAAGLLSPLGWPDIVRSAKSNPRVNRGPC